MHYHFQVARFLTSLVLAGLAAVGAGWAQPLPKGKTAGSQNAPIKIELFSDFQCPSCRTLHQQVVSQLMRDYVATGKVFLVNREFPLVSHAYARLAASYATAAARIGRYREVSDALFDNQAVWAQRGNVDEIASRALSVAEAQKVRKLATEPSIAAEIEQDMKLGTQAGLRQTPTMFIQRGSARYPVAGSLNYDILRRFLDDQLSK